MFSIAIKRHYAEELRVSLASGELAFGGNERMPLGRNANIRVHHRELAGAKEERYKEYVSKDGKPKVVGDCCRDIVETKV